MSTINFFYKYRPSNSNTMRILTDNELYFSSPLDFNDPFDCKITPSTKGTKAQWEVYLGNLLPKKFHSLPPSQIDAEVQRLLNTKRHLDPVFHEEIQQNAIDRHKNTGVLCLSGKNDNILMWSHYADNHRGLCIEFRHDKFAKKGLVGLEVKYCKSYPPISIFDSDYLKKLVKCCLLTKAIHWKYEDEYRYVIPNGKGVQKFDPTWLTGIIFGCLMPEKKKNKIRNILKGRHIKFYEAKMKKRKFGLDIVPAP